jgi:hypothetical protein
MGKTPVPNRAIVPGSGTGVNVAPSNVYSPGSPLGLTKWAVTIQGSPEPQTKLATGKSVVLSSKDRKMERLVVYRIVKLPPGARLETKETPVKVNPPPIEKGSP